MPDDIFSKKIEMKFHEETEEQKRRKLELRQRENERIIRKLKEDQSAAAAAKMEEIRKK